MSGFQSPNYTQTPNDLFAMLPDMGDAELRVTLVMIRQTFGFHREGFKLSLKKLAEAAGLSRQGAQNGAEEAEKRGTFRRANHGAQGEAEWELALNPVDTPSTQLTPPLNPVDNSTGIKESIKQEKDIVDGILYYHVGPKAIQQAIAEHFKLTPNWEAKYNRQFMEWAVENRVSQALIALAAQRWKSDKRFNWKTPDLRGIQENWLMLVETIPAQTARVPETLRRE